MKYTLKEIKSIKNSYHPVAIYTIENDPNNNFWISPCTHHMNLTSEERDMAFDIMIKKIKSQ